MSKPSFCPVCSTLLIVGRAEQQADKAGVIVLQCKNCQYAQPLSETTTMKRTDNTRETIRYLNKAMTYDQTLRRTCAVPCANDDCPTYKVPWGTKEGTVVVQPNVSLTNFFSDDRVMTYICNICGTTWQPVP